MKKNKSKGRARAGTLLPISLYNKGPIRTPLKLCADFAVLHAVAEVDNKTDS